MANGTRDDREAAAGQRKRGVTFRTVARIATGFPGVEIGTSYGTPAFKVRGKLLLRLREDGETLALRTTFPDRDFLLEAYPEVFFITDHYRGHPSVVLRLDKIDVTLLREVTEQSWRQVAPKTLVAKFDAN